MRGIEWLFVFCYLVTRLLGLLVNETPARWWHLGFDAVILVLILLPAWVRWRT